MNRLSRLLIILPFGACLLVFDLSAQDFKQLDDQIQQAITQKKYAQADKLVNVALLSLKPKTASQQRLYGTYSATKGDLALRQKKYPVAVEWAGKAEPLLDKYPPDLIAMNNLITLAYAYLKLRGDENEGMAFEKFAKAKKLQNKLNDPAIALKLADRYMTIGNELVQPAKPRKFDLFQGANLYGMAASLFEKGHDPVRQRVAMTQSLAVMEKIQREEDEDDDDDDDDKEDAKAVDQAKKTNRPSATPAPKKGNDDMAVRNPYLGLLTQMPYNASGQQISMGRNETDWEKSYEAIVAQSGDNSISTAIAHGSIGHLYLTVKSNYGKAESHLSQGIAILKQLDALNTVMGAGYLRDLSLTYMLSGQYNKVVNSLTETQNIVMQLHRNAFSSTAFSEEDKEAYIGIDWGLQMTLAFTDYMLTRKPGTWLPQMQQLSYDAALYMNGLLLDEARTVRAGILQRADPKLTSLYTAWLTQKQLIANTSITNRKAAIAKANDIAEDLTEAFSELKVVKASIPDIDWKRVKSRLGPGQVAISFVRFRAFPFKGPLVDSLTKPEDIHYAALIIRSGFMHPQFVTLGNERQLQQLLLNSGTPTKLYSNSRGGVVSSAVTHNYGDSLYQLVWKPIETLIKGATHVYYSTEGLLSRVAFAAIPLPEVNAQTPTKDRYLSGRYELHQLFSTRQLAQGLQPFRLGTAMSVALMGGVDYETLKVTTGQRTRVGDKPSLTYIQTAIQRENMSPFRHLNGSDLEVAAIHRILPRSELITGVNASEKRFRQFSGRSPAILHLATHGLYIRPEAKKSDKTPDEAMTRTALVMAHANALWQPNSQSLNEGDGLLTAYEIADLNLSQTRLVVLSACETALGDLRGPEGVFGLPRAFKMAGAEKLLLSLWPVDDARTQQLMTLFYTYLKTDLEVREAFRKAQLDVQNQAPDPSIWAAFVLVE